MPPVFPLPPEQWSPELHEAVPLSDKNGLEAAAVRINAHSPDIAVALVKLGSALRTKSQLSDRLMELMRLRIAFHNQCRSCMAVRYSLAVDEGVDEDLVCSLENPTEAAGLTEPEKLAIAYGEKLATNHLSISDSTYQGLRQHYTERQIVEVGQWAAFCVGFGRLAATWNLIEDLPAGFQSSGWVTANAGRPIIVSQKARSES